MDAHFYQVGVFCLIVLFFYLYSVLDGFDLGIGMLLPFARGKGEPERLTSHIAPFWDGNEVWLIIGAGFAFAAFPAAVASLLGAVYLPFMLFILSLILRAMALEYSYHGPSLQRMWHLVAATGSLMATFLALYLLGTLIQGLPFDEAGRLSSSPGAYVSTFPILFSLAGLVVVVWHGATYALVQDPSPVRQEAAEKLWFVLVGATLVLASAWLVFLPHATRQPFAVAGAGLCAAGVIGGRILLKQPGWAFRSSCITVTGIWVLAASSLYPYVLPARNHPEWSLTIDSAAAPVPTLRFLLITGLVLTPVILAYSHFAYRVLRRGDGGTGVAKVDANRGTND